jgi:hypothetical protein
MVIVSCSGAEMADFSWYNLSKLEKIYQMTQNIQKGRKICQMAIK